MDFFKILWRGMRDVYDSFMHYILVTLAFWLCCSPMLIGYGFLSVGPIVAPLFLVTAALAPPALTVLYAMTDPRKAVSRMEWREAMEMMRSVFVRSWKVALITIVPLIMIGWNILFFGGTSHNLALFVPLWVVMWVFLFVLTLYCFSLAGTHESGWRNAFRGGMFVLVKYPFRTVGLSLFILLVGYIFTLAILPMFVIGPAFFAAIVNRFVFNALEVHVVDPDSPTNERADERARGINLERSLMDRVMRRDRS